MAKTSKAKTEPKTQPCADCQGNGVIAWATDVVVCSTCRGRGTVELSQPDSTDRR